MLRTKHKITDGTTDGGIHFWGVWQVFFLIDLLALQDGSGRLPNMPLPVLFQPGSNRNLFAFGFQLGL